MIILPEAEKLNIQYLSHVFDNKAESYKLFWFHAILRKVSEGKAEITFEELIDEMIADAWYMVSEYHLNLGPRDTLELTVKYIAEHTDLLPNQERKKVLSYLETCTDKEVVRLKRILIQNVPYRLQAPFLEDARSEFWNTGQKKLAESINAQPHLVYYFSAFQGLDTRIRIGEKWFDYLKTNFSILEGWIQYNLIIYLQKRNPNVPGIADKLYPPKERNLRHVIAYWKVLTDIQPVYDIYGHEEMTRKNISIDHFVPWSYVTHDEFWNLHPTTRSINSSKSNFLPKWEEYFPALCRLEYHSYEMMWKYEKVHAAFDRCAGEHLNSDEIRHRLYRKGMTEDIFAHQLEEVLEPVYLSAAGSGFREWVYRK